MSMSDAEEEDKAKMKLDAAKKPIAWAGQSEAADMFAHNAPISCADARALLYVIAETLNHGGTFEQIIEAVCFTSAAKAHVEWCQAQYP